MANEMVGSISPQDLARLLDHESSPVLLLDVREPEERAIASIEPSLFIPMNSVPDQLEQIPKDRHIVVFCHHGHRSAVVASYLEGEGYPTVSNLVGGIDAWSVQVHPEVPRYV